MPRYIKKLDLNDKNYSIIKQSKKKWQKDVLNAEERDYSFKSVSGTENDLLYYPNIETNNYINTIY